MERMTKKINNTVVDSPAHREIHEAVSRISFGEVVVTIHDGKVVQIEKREKKRFR